MSPSTIQLYLPKMDCIHLEILQIQRSISLPVILPFLKKSAKNFPYQTYHTESSPLIYYLKFNYEIFIRKFHLVDEYLLTLPVSDSSFPVLAEVKFVRVPDMRQYKPYKAYIFLCLFEQHFLQK